MRIKKRTFSGTVLEQEIYTIPDGCRSLKNPDKRLRFENEEQRKQHRDGIARRRFVRIFNATFDSSSLYSTLTFDLASEVHTFEEARIIRDRYYNRLRYRYPEAVITIHMGRGKHTNRIHMHMVSKGVPEEYIRKQWFYGSVVDVQFLREHNFYNKTDCGQDYTGLAVYLFEHWTPEQGGHRYKMTRNFVRPVEEEPKEIKRNYSSMRAPAAPQGYELVESLETIYGYLWFKYIKVPLEQKEPPKRKKKATNLNVV